MLRYLLLLVAALVINTSDARRWRDRWNVREEWYERSHERPHGRVTAHPATTSTKKPTGILASQTPPQCRCTDLDVLGLNIATKSLQTDSDACRQEEYQELQSCIENVQCISFLGGSEIQVSSCLSSVAQSVRCNGTVKGTFTCSNDTTLGVDLVNNSGVSEIDSSILVQFQECVAACFEARGIYADLHHKRDKTCLDQLTCLTSLMAAQSAANNQANQCTTMQQYSTNTIALACQCLINAGVQ